MVASTLFAGSVWQIVLLGGDLKIACPADEVVRVGDVHGVFHAVVAGMRHPLAAGHELPFGRFAERVAHAAVASGRCPTPLLTASDTGLAARS